TILLRGGGATSRDYTYIDDIVAGTVAAIERAPAGYRVYNLGGSEATTLEALVARIGEALGKRPRVESVPALAGEVEHTLAGIERARADLGYAPVVALSEGLARFVEWFRSRR